MYATALPSEIRSSENAFKETENLKKTSPTSCFFIVFLVLQVCLEWFFSCF